MVIPEGKGAAAGTFNLAARESVVYSAYGIPQAISPSDFDADGLVGVGDLNKVQGGFGDSVGDANYHAGADANANGTIDLADLNAVLNYTTTQRGQLSALANTIGFGGAPYDQLFELSHMRNRWYSPWLGRWLTRDPAGYVDGMSQYLYVKGNPLIYFDPFGMASQKTCNHFLTTDNPYGTSGVVYERYDVYKDHGWWLIPGADWRYSGTKYRRTNLDPVDITDHGTLRPELRGTAVGTLADHERALWSMIEVAANEIGSEITTGLVVDAITLGAAAAFVGSRLVRGHAAIVKAISEGGEDLLDSVSAVRRLDLDASDAGIWKLDPKARGKKLEDILGDAYGIKLGEQTSNGYPVADFFDTNTGTMTSVKSIDPYAQKYFKDGAVQPKAIRDALEGYLQKTTGFKGRVYNNGKGIDGEDIVNRQLALVIPDTTSPGMMEVINDFSRQAAEQGVRVEIFITAGAQ